MKVKLQARFLWDAIKFNDVDYEQDRRALEAICAAVPLEIGATIANKPTAKLAGRRLRPGALGATAFIAPRSSASGASEKVSPFAPTSKLKILPSASPT